MKARRILLFLSVWFLLFASAPPVSAASDALIQSDQKADHAVLNEDAFDNSVPDLLASEETASVEEQEITVNGCVYRLEKKSGTLKAVFLRPSGDRVSKLEIPGAITYVHAKYPVYRIAPSACCGLEKLETLSIGENVEKIGRKAFKGCLSLESIVILPQSMTIGSSAFTGISEDVKIRIPKKTKSFYKKLLTASGVPASARYYVPGEQPKTLIRGSFDQSETTVYLNDYTCTVEGSIYAKDGYLKWIALRIRDPEKKIHWVYKDFTAQELTSAKLADLFGIDTDQPPWNQAGAYRLELWASDSSSRETLKKMAQMTVTCVVRPFVWPTKARNVSALNYYSDGNIHGNYYERKGYAIDIYGALKTPVYAAWEGTIIESSTEWRFGTNIQIRHPDQSVTMYAHLNSKNTRYQVGDYVQTGDTIGYMGKTGHVTGIHVHFEWSKGNVWTYLKDWYPDVRYDRNVYKANNRYYDQYDQCREVVDWLNQHKSQLRELSADETLTSQYNQAEIQ